MSKLRFTDGLEVDTSGEYRIKRDPAGGYLLIGHGMMVPCSTVEEAREIMGEEMELGDPKKCS